MDNSNFFLPFFVFIELNNKEHWIIVAEYFFSSEWGSTKPILKGIEKKSESREEVDKVKIEVKTCGSPFKM